MIIDTHEISLSMEEETVSCDLCGARDWIVLHTGDRYGMGLHTVYCRQCGLLFLNPRPTASAMSEFYRDHYRRFYESVTVPDEGYLERGALRKRADHVVDVVSRYADRAGGEHDVRFLDIAGAEGTFLKCVREAFPDAYLCGVEPNPQFAEYARSHAGAHIYTGRLEDYLCSAEREALPFDVITLNHVLEHFSSPREALVGIRDLLASDGILYVEVPNVVNGGGIGQIHLAHLYMFYPETLELLCTSCGYEVVDSQTEGLPGICPAMCVVLRKRTDGDHPGPPSLPRSVIERNVSRFRASLPSPDSGSRPGLVRRAIQWVRNRF
jgi:SAM-dependent methyltransferase